MVGVRAGPMGVEMKVVGGGIDRGSENEFGGLDMDFG